MFLSYADLKRAVQGNLHTKGTRDDRNSPSRNQKEDSSNPDKHGCITNGLKLNVEAQEFHPTSYVDINRSLPKDQYNTVHSRIGSSDFSSLQSSFEKLSLKDSDKSAQCSINYGKMQSQGFNKYITHEKAELLKNSSSGNQCKLAEDAHDDFLILFGSNHKVMKTALKDPGGMRAPALLDLAKLISEKAQENRSWAESLASLSFYIIEREKQTTFVEGLLNMLQYIVGKKCKDGTAGDSFYFPFISYLHALYGEFKAKRIGYEKNRRSTALTLLSLLVEVCIDFLHQEKLTGRKEIDLLFFVVTTIGRDLEADSPCLMESLMCAVRDAFLSEGASAPIRRTLLQLVELRAARWQLPARTIHYYQTYLTAA